MLCSEALELPKSTGNWGSFVLTRCEWSVAVGSCLPKWMSLLAGLDTRIASTQKKEESSVSASEQRSR